MEEIHIMSHNRHQILGNPQDVIQVVGKIRDLKVETKEEEPTKKDFESQTKCGHLQKGTRLIVLGKHTRSGS